MGVCCVTYSNFKYQTGVASMLAVTPPNYEGACKAATGKACGSANIFTSD